MGFCQIVTVKKYSNKSTGFIFIRGWHHMRTWDWTSVSPWHTESILFSFPKAIFRHSSALHSALLISLKPINIYSSHCNRAQTITESCLHTKTHIRPPRWLFGMCMCHVDKVSGQMAIWGFSWVACLGISHVSTGKVMGRVPKQCSFYSSPPTSNQCSWMWLNPPSSWSLWQLQCTVISLLWSLVTGNTHHRFGTYPMLNCSVFV